MVQLQNDLSAVDEMEMLSPLLAGLSRQTPFSLPEGYFDSNLHALPAFSASEELPAVLAKAGRSMPYEVPAGYFDTLTADILVKVRPSAKVVPMFARKWMRIAVAAVVAGIIMFSGISYFTAGKDIAVDNPQWVAKKLKNVSDSELDEFVKTTDAIPSGVAAVKTTAIRTGDVKKLLQDVPDNELDAFLSEVPSDDMESSLN
jgi:hypothetical protein